MSDMTTTKATVVSIEPHKESKNGNKYSQIILNNQPKPGIIFFQGENCPVEIGKEYDFTIKDGMNGTPIFNLKKENKFAGGFRSPGIDKNVEALKLAVQLVCAGKIELNDIPAWKDYFQKIM